MRPETGERAVFDGELQYRNRVPPHAATKLNGITLIRIELQYRNRVFPHAASRHRPMLFVVLTFQYRNRVSPHAARHVITYKRPVTGFNTAIGYHPMRRTSWC